MHAFYSAILAMVGQRESPSKPVEGAKSCLESNPIHTPEILKDSNKTLCTPGLRDSTETKPQMPLSV